MPGFHNVLSYVIKTHMSIGAAAPYSTRMLFKKNNGMTVRRLDL